MQREIVPPHRPQHRGIPGNLSPYPYPTCCLAYWQVVSEQRQQRIQVLENKLQEMEDRKTEAEVKAQEACSIAEQRAQFIDELQDQVLQWHACCAVRDRDRMGPWGLLVPARAWAPGQHGGWKMAPSGGRGRMRPPDPGGLGWGGGRKRGSSVMGLDFVFFGGQKYLHFSSSKGGANDPFSDSLRRADFKNAVFIFFLVYGPHVGPTVPCRPSAPAMAGQKSPTPPGGGGGA